jgi:MFS family permease
VPRPSLDASPRYRWWVLAVVECSILLTGVDSTIVNLALPRIASDMHSVIGEAQWVVAVSFIGTAVMLPTMGRLADMLGRKRVFLLGFGVFTLASVLCAAAPSLACS